jgi:uncharacterized Fe-S cluster protein YjdI
MGPSNPRHFLLLHIKCILRKKKPIMEKQIAYSNGEIKVIWKPNKCIHAGQCVKHLPNVYKPKERPWVQVQNATTEQLKAQINECPSGALTFVEV